MRTPYAFALAAALLAACGGGGDDPAGPSTTGTGNPGTTPSTTNAISVRDNNFSPSTTTITPGTTVTWTWSGSNPHDVTFADGTASAVQRAGTYQRTFAAAGTFAYQCSIHGASMSGTITVR